MTISIRRHLHVLLEILGLACCLVAACASHFMFLLVFPTITVGHAIMVLLILIVLWTYAFLYVKACWDLEAVV